MLLQRRLTIDTTASVLFLALCGCEWAYGQEDVRFFTDEAAWQLNTFQPTPDWIVDFGQNVGDDFSNGNTVTMVDNRGLERFNMTGGSDIFNVVLADNDDCPNGSSC